MKLGCQIKSLNKYYCKYDTMSSKIVKNLKNPSTIPNMTFKGEIYSIDRCCMRQYFSKFCSRPMTIRNALSEGNTRNRFFECEECTKYKMYNDVSDLYSIQKISTLTYPNTTPNSKYKGYVLSSDFFTTKVLVNQYLKFYKIKNILYPKNAFICGNCGFLYYLNSSRDPTDKAVRVLVKTLSKYNFSFNSLVNRELFFQIPDYSSISTHNGIRISNSNFFDFILPDYIIKKDANNFVLNLKTLRHIEKFKYMRDSGELGPDVNSALNYILIKFSLGSDILNLGEIETYDSFLSKISGIQIPLKY